MTNFAVQTTLGVAAPLVSKEKGSMGNRIDCAGAHLKNNVTTGLQAGAVLGSAYAADHLVKNSDKAIKFGSEVITKTKGASKEFIKYVNDTKAADTVKKTFTKLENSATVQNAINKIKKANVGAKAEKYTKSASDFIKNHMPKTSSTANKVFNATKNIIGKAIKAAKNLGPRKMIAAAATALLTYVVGNGIYKSGQIDQKYTDKAKFQQPFNN